MLVPAQTGALTVGACVRYSYRCGPLVGCSIKSCLSERANAPPIFKILVALNLNVKYEARGARAPISFR
jgi:hypothetical protein